MNDMMRSLLCLAWGTQEVMRTCGLSMLGPAISNELAGEVGEPCMVGEKWHWQQMALQRDNAHMLMCREGR